MPRALGGLDVLLDPVGKDMEADLVVVGDGAEGQRRADFGHEVAFELSGGAECLRAADVDEQHDRQFAFLAIAFDERLALSGGDVPVNRADVVAGEIFAHLLELHPLPLEGGVIMAGKDIARHMRRANLYSANLFQ